MSKYKIQKKFIYEGLGFPIILRNVPMIHVRGDWTLNINMNTLTKLILFKLIDSPEDLTGNQIRFIRLWLQLTQTAFGNLLGVTHPAVVRWEKFGNEPAKMGLAIQKCLKLIVLDKLLYNEDDAFRQTFRKISDAEFSKKIHTLDCDISTDFERVKSYEKLAMHSA